MIKDVKIELTTDESGDATVTAPNSYVGRLVAVEGVISALAATADITIGCSGSSGGVTRTFDTVTNSNTNFFNDIVSDAVGNTNAASGTDVHPVLVGNPTVTIAQGGDTASATIVFYIDDLR